MTQTVDPRAGTGASTARRRPGPALRCARALAAWSLLVTVSCAGRDPAAAPEQPELQARLMAEYTRTLDLWQRIGRAEELGARHGGTAPEHLYLQLARQQEVDARLLDEVFATVGWPTPRLVGSVASAATLTMAVNAPPRVELAARAAAALEASEEFPEREEFLRAARDPEAAREHPGAWVTPGGDLELAPAPARSPVEQAAGPRLPARPLIAQELVAMQARDQAVRFEFATALRAGRGASNNAAMVVIAAKQAAIDAENLVRLKEIVAEIGWPTVETVGAQAAHAAWILAQHADADPAFQEQVMGWIQPLAGTEAVEYSEVALLSDRVSVARGRPQRFGTQWIARPIGGVVHFGPATPIEDPAELDELRAAVGLPPMDEYLELLRAAYGVPEDAPPLPEGR